MMSMRYYLQGRNYHLFAGGGGGVFGEFALPNVIIPCEVIGVRFKKFSSLAGGGRRDGPLSAQRVA